MQDLLDSIGKATRMVRSDYHLTLGKAIERLKDSPQDYHVRFTNGAPPGHACSYRGYYDDLSLVVGDSEITVADLLKELQSALGATFHGYKGGEYVMDPKSPLWAAEWGCCGDAIVGVSVHGGWVELITRSIDP